MTKTKDVSLEELRARVDDHHNIAAIVPANHDVRDLSPLLYGPIVLKEAEGPLGVLRCIDMLHGTHFQKAIASEGKEARLLHLVFLPLGEGAALHDYHFYLTKEENDYVN